MHAYSTCLLSFLLLLFPLVVTVQYERERYTIAEEDGPVTLALVLDKAVSFPVTVSVNTLDLLNSSVGDAATGELLEFACRRMFYRFSYYNLLSTTWDKHCRINHGNSRELNECI